jgi:hypothetical protein
LKALVQPVRNGLSTDQSRAAEALWEPSEIDELLNQIQIVHSHSGDWQAVLYDPMQMTLAAEIAERALITEPTVGVAKGRRRHQWLARRH